MELRCMTLRELLSQDFIQTDDLVTLNVPKGCKGDYERILVGEPTSETVERFYGERCRRFDWEPGFMEVWLEL